MTPIIAGGGSLVSRFPGPKTKFNDIHVKAEPLWAEFWKKYGKACRAFGEKNTSKYGNKYVGAWVLARTIFDRFCRKRNVPPYGGNISSDEHNRLKGRMYRDIIRVNEKLARMSVQFNMNGWLTSNKILKETLINVRNDRGTYTITTSSKLKMGKDINVNEMLPYFTKNGFRKEGKFFIKNDGSHTVTFELNKKNEIAINKYMKYMNQQVIIILGLNENLNTKKKITEELSKHIRGILKDKKASLGKHIFS
jgi:hypothetical protein